MKQTGHDDLVVLYCEIDCIREASDQTTSKFFVHFLIEEGIAGDIADTGIEHTKEFIAKSR